MEEQAEKEEPKEAVEMGEARLSQSPRQEDEMSQRLGLVPSLQNRSEGNPSSNAESEVNSMRVQHIIAVT